MAIDVAHPGNPQPSSVLTATAPSMKVPQQVDMTPQDEESDETLAPHKPNYALIVPPLQDGEDNDGDHPSGSAPATLLNQLADYVADGVNAVVALATPPAETQFSNQAHKPNYPSLNMGAVGMAGDWQSIVEARTDQSIDVRDLNPEFGQRLSRACLELDKEGYEGQYEIISGVRTPEKQLSLKGTNKVVGTEFGSPHVWGCAVDFRYTGNGDSATFYETLHRVEKENGLESVKDDINHCQIADAHNYIAQLRQQNGGNPLLASNSRLSADLPAFST